MAAVRVKLGTLSDRLGCYDLDHERVWTQAALLELEYTLGDARLYVIDPWCRSSAVTQS